MDLPLSVKISLTSAFAFFMLALITGVWKYSLMTQSDKGQSRYYVDIAHRSSFLYAYAALLLAVFAYLSQFPDWLNTLAVVGSVSFYMAAVLGYVYQGMLNKTNNQIRSSIRKEPSSTPMWLTHLFTFSLIVAEIGGALVLGLGAMQAIWG
ncbi:conserved hypothetical protein [Oleispira antarctica RB-8]|uniref:Integral membrane protein n=1 Tax=Oleispira antarctica RB-8 TaxID=698738 RepID=R4YSA0_OLEAN|nr:conserved hypothetical protein [Oleispira antarctica RB-8]